METSEDQFAGCCLGSSVGLFGQEQSLETIWDIIWFRSHPACPATAMSALLRGAEKSANEPSSGESVALPKALFQKACPQNRQKEANKRPLVAVCMCRGNRKSPESSAVGQELNESCNRQV